MTSKQIYIKETGDHKPNSQIGYLEWHQRYVKWMEKFIVENY